MDAVEGSTPRAGVRSLSVVLPAYNEEGEIRRTLRGVLRELERLRISHEVIVVDDGSRDGTAAILDVEAARDPSIRIVRHSKNQGYGAAVGNGFRAARMGWVFLMDSDGQFDFTEIERLMEVQRRTGAAAVFGFRAERSDSFPRRWAGAAWTRLIRWVLGIEVRDLDCAFKLIRRDALLEAGFPEAKGAMVSAELLARLRRSGYDWEEVPVSHYPRRTGVSSGGSPRVIFRAFRELLALRRRLR